jgi:hypothetical protein
MVFKKLGRDPEPDPDSPQKPKGLDPGPASVNIGIDPQRLWHNFVCVFNSANIHFKIQTKAVRLDKNGSGRSTPSQPKKKRKKAAESERPGAETPDKSGRQLLYTGHTVST